MSAGDTVRVFRQRLRRCGLHLRAMRGQDFVIEKLTWDYKLTGEVVATISSVDFIEISKFIDEVERCQK